jgi:hypothetical protein
MSNVVDALMKMAIVQGRIRKMQYEVVAEQRKMLEGVLKDIHEPKSKDDVEGLWTLVRQLVRSVAQASMAQAANMHEIISFIADSGVIEDSAQRTSFVEMKDAILRESAGIDLLNTMLDGITRHSLTNMEKAEGDGKCCLEHTYGIDEIKKFLEEVVKEECEDREHMHASAARIAQILEGALNNEETISGEKKAASGETLQ